MSDKSHLILSADHTITEDMRVYMITVTASSVGAGKVTVYPNGSGSETDVFDLSVIQDQTKQFVFDGLLLPLSAVLDLSANCSFVLVEYLPADNRPGGG